MSILRPIHHYHEFIEEDTEWGDPKRNIKMTIVCRDVECYPNIDKDLFPAEKIGPKLRPGDHA